MARIDSSEDSFFRFHKESLLMLFFRLQTVASPTPYLIQHIFH